MKKLAILMAVAAVGVVVVLAMGAQYYRGPTNRVTFLPERGYKYAATPQLADIYNSELRESGIERFTVSTDGITRIHDLINDPIRDCVWGITRSDTANNYVFRIDRDGTVTKALLGGAGENMCMNMTWGGSYLWASVFSSPGQLLRIDPSDLSTTFFELAADAQPATGIAYNDGLVFVAVHLQAGTDTHIYRFNVSTGAISKYTVSDVYTTYWGLSDGTYFWFSGADPNDDSAKLIKMAADGTYSTYDLGLSSSGSEITYDGTYIWQGNNEGTEIAVRFDTRDDSITSVDPDVSPRLIGFDGELLWLVGTATSYTRMSAVQSLLTEEPAALAGATYTHGLTFDGVNAWIGTWQDTCYIYRVPMYAFAPSRVKDVSLHAESGLFADTLSVNTASTTYPSQVFRGDSGWTSYIKNSYAGAGANSGLLIDAGQDGGDIILSLRSLAGTSIFGVSADGLATMNGELKVASAILHGGLTLHTYEATSGTFTNSDTITIQVNVPAGARIVGVQLHVKTALAGGETWDATYEDGGGAMDDLAIGTGQAVAQDTNVNLMFDTNATSDVTDAEVDIKIQRNSDPGTDLFTAQGEIEAVVYAWSFDAWTNE